MLVKKDVLVLNGQKLVQGMQVHEQLMLQIMPQRIAAHHLLRLFVQLAIDKDQWLIKILKRDDLTVKEVHGQYSIKNLQGRSVRLDILAVDRENRAYNMV